MDSAGKAKEQQGKVEHHAQLFGPLLEDVLADVQPQTEYKWRECFDALQEARNSLLSVSGVSPMQLAFGQGSWEISGSDREQFASTRQRRWTGGQSSDNSENEINAQLRQAQCQESAGHQTASGTNFPPGDMVAVWRMTKGGGIPGKEAHRPGICVGSVRGNYWIAVPGSVVMASPEDLRPAAREERHVWRVVEAETRTKLATTGNNKNTSS